MLHTVCMYGACCFDATSYNWLSRQLNSISIDIGFHRRMSWHCRYCANDVDAFISSSYFNLIHSPEFPIILSIGITFLSKLRQRIQCSNGLLIAFFSFIIVVFDVSTFYATHSKLMSAYLWSVCVEYTCNI